MYFLTIFNWLKRKSFFFISNYLRLHKKYVFFIFINKNNSKHARKLKRHYSLNPILWVVNNVIFINVFSAFGVSNMNNAIVQVANISFAELFVNYLLSS